MADDDGYKVVTSALRAEAPKWDEFAAAIEPVKRAVDDATLGILAFFSGNPHTLGVLDANGHLHRTAYEQARTFMSTVLTGALTELPQITDALKKTATEYDDTEGKLAAGFVDEIWDAKKW